MLHASSRRACNALAACEQQGSCILNHGSSMQSRITCAHTVKPV